MLALTAILAYSIDVTAAHFAIEIDPVAVPVKAEVTSLTRIGCKIRIKQPDAFTAKIALAEIGSPV